MKKEIGVGRLAQEVYNFSHEQANHTSIISLGLLHKRLGHPSFSTLENFNGFSSASNSSHDFFICFHAKESRSSFPLSNTTSDNLFDLIYCNI